MQRHSVKSILLASLAAVLVVLAQPSVFMLSMLICIAPIAIAALYAWAGWIPAGIASAGTVGSLVWFASVGGTVNPALAGLGAAAVLVAPGIVSIVLLERRTGFFKRMLITVGAQLAALLGCVAVVYLGMGIDLVDAITGMMRQSVEYMPEDMILQLLQMFYYSGMLTEESIAELSGGVLLYADVLKIFDQVFELTNYQLKQVMPAMLINSGLISGVLETTLPSQICIRRGDEPPVPHVPLHEWFLPSRAVGFAAVGLVTGIVLQYMDIDGAIGVTAVFSQLAGTLLIIQGMASVTRRFREAGSGRGARIGLVIAGLLFAPTFLQIVGAASVLFGRKGVISTWMRKRMEEMDEDRKDDDE